MLLKLRSNHYNKIQLCWNYVNIVINLMPSFLGVVAAKDTMCVPVQYAKDLSCTSVARVIPPTQVKIMIDVES